MKTIIPKHVLGTAEQSNRIEISPSGFIGLISRFARGWLWAAQNFAGIVGKHYVQITG